MFIVVLSLLEMSVPLSFESRLAADLLKKNKKEEALSRGTPPKHSAFLPAPGYVHACTRFLKITIRESIPQICNQYILLHPA